MVPFSKPPISILLFFSLLIFVFEVRSQHVSSAIRLPSEATNNDRDLDLCPVSLPSSCPVKCFRTDPVCGVDGLTYWCGCADALCSGVKVAKMGFCEFPSCLDSSESFGTYIPLATTGLSGLLMDTNFIQSFVYERVLYFSFCALANMSARFVLW
ncbi:hypothetical protein SDJN03_24185, partial [Cucurbita argyrosperma subsp. sororia]